MSSCIHLTRRNMVEMNISENNGCSRSSRCANSLSNRVMMHSVSVDVENKRAAELTMQF